MSLLAELKRRNVIRVAGLYLVAAWLITQVASTVFPAFELPSWALRGVILLLAIGFIPAVILSWVFELTPGGIKRDADVPPEHAMAAQTARRMDRMIIGGLAAVIVFMVVERLWPVAIHEAKPGSPVAGGAPELAAAIDSIAVLAFRNTGGDADSEYLSDGLAESLIYRLAQLPNLKVSPSSSIFRYKGKDTDPLKVGAELGVRAVMSGRLVQRGEDLNISVELLDVRSNALLWGEQYSRKMSELLATQREIATEITSRLRLKLSGEGQQKLSKKYTDSNEAYQHYLKGRYFWARRDEENLRKAIVQFEAAAQADPNFALALVGLADCYVLLPYYSGAKSSEVLPLTHRFVTRAIEIDDSLGEAHATLGYYHLNAWDWAEAEASFRRAIDLKPNYATAHQWFGLYLMTMGRFAEAESELLRAQELEPLALAVHNNLVELYTRTGDFKAAMEQGQRTIELDSKWYFVRFSLALAELKQGHLAEAVAGAELGVELSKRQNTPLGVLGYAYATVGRRADAMKIIEELKEREQKGQAVGLDISRVYGGLGERDLAFDWLEKEYESRNQKLPIWLGLIYYERLRDDPRFEDLRKRMGLPEAGATP